MVDEVDPIHAPNENGSIFRLGVYILVAFFILMTLVLIGCFFLMTGRMAVDNSMVAVATGLIGSVVGYASAYAQQVVSFYFGSSKGSKDSGATIGAALTESLKTSGRENLNNLTRN